MSNKQTNHGWTMLREQLILLAIIMTALFCRARCIAIGSSNSEAFSQQKSATNTSMIAEE